MQWTYPERHPVGPGPWESEPDKAQWIDEPTDLDCLAVRNMSGAWCGYVGVPPGHPWYDQDYYDVPVTVHGGLTYGARCCEDEPEPAICHVPAPGRPADVYWLGFDCNHSEDLAPTVEASMAAWCESTGRGPWRSYGTYRTLDYVWDQCRSLAAQIAQAGRS